MINSSISIIIPIKITFSNKYLLERLIYLIDFFSNYKEIETIIVDSSKSKKYKNIIKNLSSGDNKLYIYSQMQSIYSASKARNSGAKVANGKYLLFYDVDLIMQSNFIFNILEDIEEIENSFNYQFKIYPCFYLSEKKSKKIQKNNLQNKDFEKIKRNYLEGYSNDVLYLAVNTSTILVSKEHFLNIGGYNENFEGHGYEDFELIHRLYKFLTKRKLPKEYLLDYKTPFPARYKGFRQYFAYLALPNLFKNRYTLHLWHPRPLSKKYYRNRANNFNEFIKIISKDVNLDTSYSVNNKYKKFIIELLQSSGYDDIEKYCGFFRLNDYAFSSQKHSSFLRKMRKFILSPKLFVKDMFKKRGIDSKKPSKVE